MRWLVIWNYSTIKVVQEVSPALLRGFTERPVCFWGPPSRRGTWELIRQLRPLAVNRNRRLNNVALLDPLRSVQFSSVQSSYLVWTLLGIIFFLRPLHSMFKSSVLQSWLGWFLALVGRSPDSYRCRAYSPQRMVRALRCALYLLWIINLLTIIYL